MERTRPHGAHGVHTTFITRPKKARMRDEELSGLEN